MFLKNISKSFEKALKVVENFDVHVVSKEMEKIPDIWCRLEDDSNLNWYAISRNNGKTVIEDYGYLSARFPIAVLMKGCPIIICKLLSEKGVIIEEYNERYSCEEKILRKYVDDIILIDDRFLYDENIPYNEELFLKIDEGINYINPYNFAFDDIK